MSGVATKVAKHRANVKFGFEGYSCFLLRKEMVFRRLRERSSLGATEKLDKGPSLNSYI